jgi:hypothetical protein
VPPCPIPALVDTAALALCLLLPLRCGARGVANGSHLEPWTPPGVSQSTSQNRVSLPLFFVSQAGVRGASVAPSRTGKGPPLLPEGRRRPRVLQASVTVA